MSERPAVSLSMALKCRSFIWLNGHGYAQEEPTQTAGRTFGIGHLAEAAMFDGIKIDEDHTVGPWWETLEEITDNSHGVKIKPSEWDVIDRQREVEVDGFKGHIDGLLKHKIDGTVLLVDMKTTGGFGYDRNLKGDLNESPFSRGYVGQLHAYRLGLLAQGQRVDGMLLLYFNKEQSKVMFRYIDYDPAIDAEIHERLSWANATAEPTPDYEWTRGQPVGLACSYCSQRPNCAIVRGMGLALEFNKKGSPVWRAA